MMKMERYFLLLVAGTLGGFFIGDLVGAGGLLGALVGALLVDALCQYRGARRLVAEIELTFRDLLERKWGSTDPSLGETPAAHLSHPGGTPDQGVKDSGTSNTLP